MAGSRWVFAIVLAGVPALSGLAAEGEPEPGGARRELRDTLGASVNLPGLQNWLELS